MKNNKINARIKEFLKILRVIHLFFTPCVNTAGFPCSNISSSSSFVVVLPAKNWTNNELISAQNKKLIC